MSRVSAFIFVSLAAVSTGCATTGATPRPFPTPAAPTSTPNSATPSSPTPKAHAATAQGGPGGYEVTGTALGLRGRPYRDGGADPSGFDCSGFVNYVFGQNGIAVPRTVAEQYRAGRPVTGQQLEAGDLVFFSTVSSGASHVGIAIGGDEFVHAPSGRGEVRVERMSAPYWSTRFVGARRVL
jgi:cell wall-associated NlpC family hydrolase